jgi:hypothetical protein
VLAAAFVITRRYRYRTGHTTRKTGKDPSSLFHIKEKNHFVLIYFDRGCGVAVNYDFSFQRTTCCRRARHGVASVFLTASCLLKGYMASVLADSLVVHTSVSSTLLYDSRLKETKIMVVVVVVLTIIVRIITRVQLKSSSNWL